MAKLTDLLTSFEKFWPSAHADEWDRVGLVTGSQNNDISRVLVSVDLTNSVIDEAIAVGAQCIVSHHPLLLRGINSANDDELKGQLLSKLIRNNLACYAAHTNADSQVDGASRLMASVFGLESVHPLVPLSANHGHGAIGNLTQSMKLLDFAQLVARTLPTVARKVAFSGDANLEVSRVAICSGAGDSFIQTVLATDADVYVTSDLRHHVVQDAVSTPRSGKKPLALIDVSHWASESLWVGGAVEKIAGLSLVEVVASKIATDPWTSEVKELA